MRVHRVVQLRQTINIGSKKRLQGNDMYPLYWTTPVRRAHINNCSLFMLERTMHNTAVS